MAAVIPNIALGRVVELVRRVDINDPATARMGWILCSGVDTDANLRDYTDLAAALAGPLNEITNTGYARVYQEDTVVTMTAPTHASDRWDVDLPDPAFGSILTGAVTAATRVGLVYDPNAGGGDAAMVPCGWWDYPAIFDGSAITPSVDVAGFFRASQV